MMQPASLTSRIHGTGVEDATLSEGTITYDIRFLATAPVSGELIRLIINIEAQNDFYPGYPLIKRGIYYCSRMISAQYGTEFMDAHYEKIKKVYSIWICMNPPKNRENSITGYVISEKNLIGNVKEKKSNYDLMTAVMICLGKKNIHGYKCVKAVKCPSFDRNSFRGQMPDIRRRFQNKNDTDIRK